MLKLSVDCFKISALTIIRFITSLNLSERKHSLSYTYEVFFKQYGIV